MNNYFINAYNINESLRRKEMLNEGFFGNLGITDDIENMKFRELVVKSAEIIESILRSPSYKDSSNMYTTTDDRSKTHMAYWVWKVIYNYSWVCSKNIKPADVPELDVFEKNKSTLMTTLWNKGVMSYIISPETLGDDPVDFTKTDIKLDSGSEYVTPFVCICNFKNLRSLNGLIKLKRVKLLIWNCPKVKSLDGVKVKGIDNVGFFPDAVEGITVGKTKCTELDVYKWLHCARITSDSYRPARVYSASGSSSRTNDEDRINKALARANDPKQFDEPARVKEPKTVSKAAPVVSNPMKDIAGDLPVFYRQGDMLYKDPGYTDIVAKIARNNISIYKFRPNGKISPNIWLKYNENDKIAYTIKGTPGYKIE